MIVKKFLKIIHQQAGYTLLELLVVVAILSLLAVAINSGITHTVRVGADGSEYVTAIKQVENAMQWFSRDVQQAHTINISQGNGFPLGLSWIEWDGTTHAVTYQFNGTDLERIHTTGNGSYHHNVIARYVNTSEDSTNCRFTDKGSFSLPDVGDSFTISGGEAYDEGLVVTSTGSVSVAVSGNATYDSGMWTTVFDDDAVVVTAASAGTRGIWTSTNMNISVSPSTDIDVDSTISGNAILVKITAAGGESSDKSETRISLIFPRSRN